MPMLVRFPEAPRHCVPRADGREFGPRCRLRLRLGLRLLANPDLPGKLPSVRALAAATRVHRNTAAAVYRDLAGFGLVRTVPGSGTYVVRREGRPPLAFGSATPADLRDLLARELGCNRAAQHGAPGCVPLDAIPPPGERSIPVAPRGAALTAILRAGAGTIVVLHSAAPTVLRLVHRAVRALHGHRVGFLAQPRRVPLAESRFDPRSCRVIRLVDTAHPAAGGTRPEPTGLLLLRLVSDEPGDAPPEARVRAHRG